MTDNVFAPPASTLEDRGGPDALWEMPFKELARLRNASINIRVFGFLFGLGAAGSLLMVGLGGLGAARSNATPGTVIVLVILLASGLLSAAACAGAYARPRWGRVVGFIACAVNMIGFPLGTLIGALGLYAYYRGDKLFGPERFLHNDVVAAYKARSAAKR